MDTTCEVIPDELTATPVLDALKQSLHEHAQAHRVQPGNEANDARKTVSITTGRLRQALGHLANKKPSPLSNLLVFWLGRLGKIPRPFLDLGYKTVAAYHFFGIMGIVSACVFPVILAGILHVSVLTILALIAGAALLTWAYIKITILITKKDAVVFFNYFLTLLAGLFLLLRILNQPALVYMDIMILGVGLLFAFGRIGCFMAGCCYGKPSHFGVQYDKHHKKNGFPRLLLRVRLLPLQLIESAWLFLITACCTVLLFTTNVSGIVLSTFLVLLGLGRFVLEFFRGDPVRPYTRGLSQTQWTSVILILSTLALQALRILPFEIWQSFILVSFLILLIASIFRSWNVSQRSLYSAKHIHEIAELFDVFKRGNLIPASTHKAVHVKRTSLNIQLSENRIPIQGRTALHHITLSSLNQQMPYRHAAGLSRYMVSWYRQAGIHVLLPDNDNIYHLIHFMTDTK